eukprot:scaffold2836_cov42-Phaeocystis_antarctica.AAC.1
MGRALGDQPIDPQIGGSQVQVRVAVGRSREDDGARGHVDAHGEGLGGEEHAHEVLLEEELDDLLEHGQQARVVHL